jgi:hypothetical protein
MTIRVRASELNNVTKIIEGHLHFTRPKRRAKLRDLLHLSIIETIHLTSDKFRVG